MFYIFLQMKKIWRGKCGVSVLDVAQFDIVVIFEQIYQETNMIRDKYRYRFGELTS